MAIEIAVVGSVNQDIVARVARHPAPGETILAAGHFVAAGGKGANQAVAAARLGRSVALVGRVGADAAGTNLLASLRADGVDVAHVGVDETAGTGLAMIVVDDAGENSIVVSPGANGRVQPADVAVAEPVLRAAAVLLLQLEVPTAAIAAAAALAAGTVILNPAPAGPLPADLLRSVDVLVPNQTELGILAGTPPPDGADAAAAIARRIEGPGAIVVTLGGEGALVVTGARTRHVPAPAVTAVDTTAAGDAFCGGLADALCRGADLVEATEWAVRVGATAVTRLGAQPSLPTAREVVPAPR